MPNFRVTITQPRWVTRTAVIENVDSGSEAVDLWLSGHPYAEQVGNLVEGVEDSVPLLVKEIQESGDD